MRLSFARLFDQVQARAALDTLGVEILAEGGSLAMTELFVTDQPIYWLEIPDLDEKQMADFEALFLEMQDGVAEG